MVTAVTIIGILIAAAVIAAAYFANRERRRSVREFNRARHASTYRLNRLNQQTFNKAFNIVSDLVKNDGADIEVMFDNQVVFNGYTDITELGEQPQFWYNKALLDKYGIEY